MVKRKAQTSSESEDGLPKRSNNSVKESYIHTANLMSKTKLLHKGLNLTTNAAMFKVNPEISSDSESEADTPTPKLKSKTKKKRKDKVSVSNSESDSERLSTIELLLNETRKNVLSKKSKKSQNLKSPEKVSSAFTPKIKQEPVEESSLESEVANVMGTYSSDFVSKSVNITNKIKSQKGAINNSIKRHSQINETLEENDNIMMESIESTVDALQNIKLNPAKTKIPQQQLYEMYPNIKLTNIHTKLKLKDSDDGFLLRIPKSVDSQNLLNVDIDLEESCKINIGGEKYIIRTTSKIPDPILVLSNKTEIVNFKRNLVMEKYVKAKKNLSIPIVEKSSVPLPKNLKNRHPLFGSNFEAKIQLDEAVEKKLDDAIRHLLKASKKKKDSKKIRKERMSLINSTPLPDIFASATFNPDVSSISPQKKSKKKKQKSTAADDDIGNIISNDFESISNDFELISKMFDTSDVERKSKKRKIKKEASVSSEFSKDFELNNIETLGTVDDKGKTKKRKIKEEPIETTPPKKKKKKKNKTESF